MSCPAQCVLGQNLSFTVQARGTTGTGVTPTGNVSYSIYENTTTTAILSGTMTKDFNSQTGLCIATIACTTANGFEQYKSYTAYITATVSAISLAKAYTFQCVGADFTITPTTNYLTTTANFKTYIGKTDSDDDSLILSLIARATDAIEKFCNRTFNSTSHRDRYDGDGTKELLLRNFPIISIEYISIGVLDAMTFTNTDSTAYNARVMVDSTNMTCYIDGGTNDGSDDLTLASYTLSTLDDAITALGKGWSASAVTNEYGLWDATEILPTQGVECLDSYGYIQIPDEPVTNLRIEYNEGIVHIPKMLTRGRHNIVAKYVAGYAAIPSDLEQICIDLVNSYWGVRKHSASVKSEKLGDHSITFATELMESGMPKSIQMRLAPYKKWSTSD